MGRQSSFLKIEGNIEGLSFYKGADGVYYVRSKGGIDKNRIKKDPAFKRTRENGAEFGHVATSGKQFRRAIQNLLFDVKDRTRIPRLMRTLSLVKNQDATSNRGERKVGIGMQTPEGKALFNHFEFNQNAGLDTVLQRNYALDTGAGELTIPDFIPALNLSLPEGATDVALSAALLRFDFETDSTELIESNVEQLVINETPASIALTFPSTPSGTGLDYYFLKVSFFQTVNNTLYPLQNGAHNALQLIEIM
ncbi:hypothetical protein INR76_00295 [Marixanthomonas sp. SCSIO 43207]|uniref:hypothetical protein n=1 Tax=Marixanthomonas sp. SCSIO 43207 TaxID=2779360 RepID=UPI001CA89D6F|nr:hypothetical protein [Marixanthomonas sp. SCSIO 43207]UAB81231.1 hypothetical protein INR76_00295 [Marixanthomonas sp. SCSIO 43207]